VCEDLGCQSNRQERSRTPKPTVGDKLLSELLGRARRLSAKELNLAEVEESIDKSSSGCGMSRPQFFQAIPANSMSHNHCHRLLQWLLGLVLPLMLGSPVCLFDMRVCYAPILLSSLHVGVIHQNECEGFSRLVVLQVWTAIVLCARLWSQFYNVVGTNNRSPLFPLRTRNPFLCY
jgi:hypothetical protein